MNLINVRFQLLQISNIKSKQSQKQERIHIHSKVKTQLNSTQRASMDAGDKIPQCPHLSSQIDAAHNVY